MTKDNMQNIFYAILMTKATLTSSHGVNIYQWDKRVNSRHSIDNMIDIQAEKMGKFERLSGFTLKEPIKVELA